VENFICNPYGGQLAILNTENIKICGFRSKGTKAALPISVDKTHGTHKSQSAAVEEKRHQVLFRGQI